MVELFQFATMFRHKNIYFPIAVIVLGIVRFINNFNILHILRVYSTTTNRADIFVPQPLLKPHIMGNRL